MSSVSRDAAVGTITLQLILFFLPSIAMVLQRPTRPNLAALKNKMYYPFGKTKFYFNQLRVVSLSKVSI